jgi:hypothetical protein
MKTIQLQQKTHVLSMLIVQCHDLYNNGGLNEPQKALLETLIGAGIWYLPSSHHLFSGFISKEAYQALKADPFNTKLVQEHGFPRKKTGELLFSPEMKDVLSDDGQALAKLYTERFGRYNLVLKAENNKLKKFQKKGVFIDEATAYAMAGIELVPFSQDEFRIYKRNQTAKKKKVY